MNGPRVVRACAVALLLAAGNAEAADTEASEPKGVSIAVYDTGFGLVTELRSVQMAKGENTVRFLQLPGRLDPSTISVSARTGREKLDLIRLEFRDDLSSPSMILAGYLGRDVAVIGSGSSATGVLVAAPWSDGQGRGLLAVSSASGDLAVFPRIEEVQQIVFPKSAGLEPTLTWTGLASEDSRQSIRLSYLVDGLTWTPSYEMILEEGETQARLAARALISNRTGGDFVDARVRFVETEKGDAGRTLVSGDSYRGSSAPELQVPYGAEEPVFERLAASPAALRTYDLPGAVTLVSGRDVHLQLFTADAVALRRFYVYDGVKFDRFQRDARNDWNYGTKSRRTVESYVEFKNAATDGLGREMPRGRLRLYRQGRDGALELAGDALLPATPAGQDARVMLGPAQGLRGDRERTGYTEVMPLHVYEESFEIRLENGSAQEAEIRVVEHLYRWHAWEIVKADTDYAQTGARTIEFKPVVKPGGNRSIHYTVRYRW